MFTDRETNNRFNQAIAIAVLAALIFLAGAMYGAADNPHCFEDEAITWDGDAHTICTPTDNLARNTTAERNMRR